MRKAFKIAVAALACIGVIAATLRYISTSTIAILEPKGIIALKERHLIVTASELMLIVVVPVLILTLVFAWRFREDNAKARHAPDWEHNTIAECFWWGVPMFIVAVLAVITWRSSHELNPYRPLESDKKPVTIQVVALQWKWLFIYPEENIATVNYIHIPVDTPINFQITADAPMNSFWIPQLGGQIYAMPAMVSKLHLIANQEGNYRGLSANISGTGFAGMTFTAYATSEEAYGRWVSMARSSGTALDKNSYRALVPPTQNVPESTYVLKDNDLFNEIVKKYAEPNSSLKVE